MESEVELAQIAAASPVGPDSLLPLILLFVAALFWLLLAIWALTRRWHAVRTARRTARLSDLYRAIADLAPGGWLLVDRFGQCRVGGGAKELLGLSRNPERLDDLCAAGGGAGIAGEDARLLGALVSSEDSSGEAIISTVGGRTIRVWRSGELPDGRNRELTLLWLLDITDQAASRAARQLEDAARRDREEGLRTLIDSAPFPIWLRNRQLDLVMVNDAYVRAVEAASSSGVLERQIDIVANALTGSSRDGAAHLLENDGISEERHFAVVEGQRRALAITQKRLGDRILGFAVDVTEAEESRGEIARLLDGHSETLNKLSSPVAIFDAEQHLRFTNSAFARMFRLSEDWLAEHPDHNTLIETMREKRRLPEQADFRAWKRQELDLHHAIEPVEELWHLPDGATLRMVAQPHPLGGLLLLFEDVTNSLALESNYNTLIAVQRETLNNLHEAVAVFGSDGRMKLHNPNYARIWGLDPAFLDTEPHFGEILEHSKALLHTGGDWQELKARLVSQIAERVTQSGRWHRPDGRVLDYALVPLPDGRTLTTHIDSTDSFRIEHALRERNEALETADRLKSEFVANMSYELRTPLNSIIGFSELLSNAFAGPLTEKQRDYIGFVLSAAGQLRDLIDDILDLAVIEAGAMTLDIARVPVADIIESALSLAREQARKGGLTLVMSVEDGCGDIEADQRRLTQALYNLVGNAIKFTPRGGSVTVSARAHGADHVELVVADTGIGIADEDRDIVFKKFNTGSAASTRKGVGLGLSLVQSFIELHRGSVDLVSRPQQGTTVTCILPKHQRQPDDADALLVK